MREDYKNDWVKASLVNDLNYLKTGVQEYDGKKDYYSTGSIKDDSIISEGAYTYDGRPSRANRVGQIGDILQARMKDTDKAVFITNDLNDQLFSTGFFQIRTDSRTLLPKYLFHYFKSFVFLNQKDSNCSGSTQSALNDKSAKNLFVPIAPIPIQRQIVSKIEELFSDLDKGIADLKKAQDQLKVYRQAVLEKAFEGELTKEWREQQTDLPTADELLEQIKEERQKHYEQQLENWKQAVKAWEEKGKEGKKLGKPVKLSDFMNIDGEGRINKELEWLNLSLQSLKTYSIYGPRFSSKDYVENGTAVLRTTDISDNGKVDWLNAPKLPLDDFDYEKYKLIKNDLLITRTGSIGRVSVFNDDKRAIPGAFLIHYRLIKSIYVWYVFYFLKSHRAQNHLIGNSSGVGRPNLNVPNIEKLLFPIPAPKEQHQIVQEIESRLSVCDKVEESITESLEKAKALRQSILKKAFEGTLLSEEEIEACKAAPDYEPASVLLEKIKAEKKKK